MPFTFAHPIATAPIWFSSNRKLHLPSLLVGSIVPDLDYFLRLHPVKTVGHTFTGISLPGLPYSIAILLVIRYVLMRPFLAFLPQQLSRKFPLPKSYFPLQIWQLLNIVVSVMLGAVTHLIWDSFTHPRGWLVVHSELLKFAIGSISIYQLVQSASGGIGVICLLLWLFTWLDRSESRHRTETLTTDWRGAVMLCLGCCSFMLAIMAVEFHHVAHESFAEVCVRAIIGGISGLFVGLFLYSVAFWIVESFKPGSITV
jgi:hypothetical protein